MALGSYAVFLNTFYVLLNLSYYYVIISYFLVIFDLHTIYAMRLLKSLENKVLLWIIHVLNSQEIEDMRGESYNKRVLQVYVDMLDCYGILKVYFQQYVSTLPEIYDLIFQNYLTQ